ncbi:MAG: hypothetical protein CVU71_04610 [Deltaproteobacteria bacterium HGW-Deltaproteobacteria-6]|nr:MAG: hypothetical protein CVU71_04610 [Deltaproteobacteria bacterium HGW-Deltaproteobacteria-6]
MFIFLPMIILSYYNKMELFNLIRRYCQWFVNCCQKFNPPERLKKDNPFPAKKRSKQATADCSLFLKQGYPISVR